MDDDEDGTAPVRRRLMLPREYRPRAGRRSLPCRRAAAGAPRRRTRDVHATVSLTRASRTDERVHGVFIASPRINDAETSTDDGGATSANFAPCATTTSASTRT